MEYMVLIKNKNEVIIMLIENFRLNGEAWLLLKLHEDMGLSSILQEEIGL